MAQHVLVVDDDKGMQDAFRLILDRAGYATTVMPDAEAILDGLQTLPDIFILDKQLSGVDGLDVCRFLKSNESTRAIPVIIVSATPHIAHLAEAACADAFLEKPFKKNLLLEAVSRCLAQRENAA